MIDYSTVTEAPGIQVTREAAAMLHTRYSCGSRLCRGKDVLELGCGTGMGLGLLARSARRLVGGDYTQPLLSRAHGHYQGRVPLLRLDAQVLPFTESCFDLVILFEAIYYLARPSDFLNECHRVLRPDGVLLLCSANREWEGFIPSPHSTRYFSAVELRQLLSLCGFQGDVYGAFQTSPRTFRQKLAARVRKAALRLHLIPKTMKGKEILKHLFYGQLVELPHELEDEMPGVETPVFLAPNGPVTGYKVLYAVGRRMSKQSEVNERTPRSVVSYSS